jgi:2-oxoglutarate dehydrogenase complex dehydrogenase (E1) component-like enzyme
VDPNVFETANAGFAQAMYEEFLRDPNAVGPEWRRLFESGVVGEKNGSGAAGQRGSGADGQRGSGAAGPRGSQSTPTEAQNTDTALLTTPPQPARSKAPPPSWSPI